MEHIQTAAWQAQEALKPQRSAVPASGTTAPAISLSRTPPSTSLARDEGIELQRRRVEIEKALALRQAAYEREPLEGKEKGIKVGVWVSSLEVGPFDLLVPLMRAELSKRTNRFLPVPADLLARWRGEETTATGEVAARSNACAYTTLEPTPNELAWRAEQSGRALPAGSETRGADEPGDGRCDCGSCQVVRLKLEKAKTRAVTAPREMPRMTPRDEQSLGAALCAYTEMETWRIKRETWTAFGWWLLSQHAVADWTPALARQQWEAWQREQDVETTTKPANAEVPA